MSKRSRRSVINRSASSVMSQTACEAVSPSCCSIIDWSQARPAITCPPLRPDVPQPTCFVSNTATL
jgi:hypothetical protein